MDFPRVLGDGGPAFLALLSDATAGLSLRDYIASHAAPHVLFAGFTEVRNGKFAVLAYEFADTMLEARKRPHE